MKKNVLIIGEAKDLYRTQTFVRCVLDKYAMFNLTYISIQVEYVYTRNLLKKIFNKLKRTVDLFIRSVFIAYQLLYADIVYIPAMSVASVRLIRLARLLNKKILSEYYISMYDTLVNDRKVFKEGDVAARKYKEYDTMLQKESHVIYLNKTEAERYSGISGLKLEELGYSIIPLAVKERNKAKLKYFTEGNAPFNVVWWGTYIPLHGLEKLLEVFRIISSRDENCYFYILGNNEELSMPYKKFVSEHNLSARIVIRNDISFSNGKLEEFLIENCSLALGVFGDSEKARSVIVNKAIEAIGMKLPVLTQYSAAFADFFNPGESIFMCNATIDEVVASIMSVKKMKQTEITLVVDNAYEIFCGNFSTHAAYNSYERLLNDYSERLS